MSILCPTLVDQQTRKRRPVSVFCRKEKRVRKRVLHNTASDHEQTWPWEFKMGRLAACIRVPWGRREQTTLNTHLPIVWHACPCTRAHVHTGFTRAAPSHRYPRAWPHSEGRTPPEVCGAWRGAGESKAHPSCSSDSQKLEEWKRGPGQSRSSRLCLPGGVCAQRQGHS